MATETEIYCSCKCLDAKTLNKEQNSFSKKTYDENFIPNPEIR
jgi:membrane-bound inhibitor of C-type lysozyme